VPYKELWRELYLKDPKKTRFFLAHLKLRRSLQRWHLRKINKP
jgi:hypothetical protein